MWLRLEFLESIIGKAEEYNITLNEKGNIILLRNKKIVFWFLIAIISISLICGWIQHSSQQTDLFRSSVNSFLIISGIILFLTLIYAPVIFLIRLWWNKKVLKYDISNNQKIRSVNKFIRNGNAMIGAVTILYAILLALFSHLISPDITPYANDQINELAFQSPGFSIKVLKQPLELSPPKTNFINWVLFGKKVDYRSIPLTNYYFVGDSLYIDRFIGEGSKGQKLGFLMKEITGEDLPLVEQQKIIESKHISTRKFLLGTDDLGRDYLSRILLGIRVSLSVGVVAVIIALFIGIPLGAFAGFYKRNPPYIRMKGKRSKFFIPVDNIIMWFINIIWAIPTLLLVFPIVFAFGQNFYTIFIAVGLTMWVDIARIVRGQVMQVREQEFVQAAKTFGFSDMRTIFIHILPNIVGPIIVITAANFAYAILTEAGLSFLGIGVQAPAPSWGLMIAKYKDNLITDPYLALIPGFAITILVLAFFMVGNGLRDALDIKSKLD